MANTFDENGLSLATRDYWLDFFQTKFQEIYGNDVNLESDTPDGQLIGIVIQVILDLQDLIAAVNQSFDPDQAVGVILDQRVALNGVQRLGGTYTVTPITLVNDRSINLYGLDQSAQPVYTISDNDGNRWNLQTSQLGLAAGTHVLNFQAENAGAELAIPNTIVNQVTVVLGVVSVNNPSTYTSLGINEETDPQLRVRRQKSVSLASQGYYSGLYAALLNINGVTGAYIYENKTDTTDSDGVPGHSIWVIVGGSGAAADIANAIYRKRNAGCGMYGTQSYVITQVNGTLFTVNWDQVVARTLFCKFTVTSIDGVVSPNIAGIRSGLPAAYAIDVFQPVDTTALGTAVQSIDDNALVSSAGFTLGTVQILSLSGVPASGVFKVRYNGNLSADINWNDNVATIQTKIRAISGLSTAVVTGSLASQAITVNLSTLTDVLSLLTVSGNTLQTSAPAAISFTLDPNWQSILNAPTKQNQLSLAAANIVITPMQLTPSGQQVSAAGTVTFVGLGGYGSYTYSISVNASGGSINASTGVYTAGGVSGTDTIKVVDAFGNQATTTVTVV